VGTRALRGITVPTRCVKERQRRQASLMLFSIVGKVKLAEIATVNGILNNGLPFKTASDLRTAFLRKRHSRLVGVFQNSQRDSTLMFFYLLPTTFYQPFH